MANGRISVLFGTEGTYPYYGGGVSVWSEILFRELHSVDFYIFAVTGGPNLSTKYDIPANVKKVAVIPLWGANDPAEFTASDSHIKKIIKRKKITDNAIIESQFIGLFKQLLRKIFNHDSDQLQAVLLINRLYHYFQEYDYKSTFRSKQLWHVFLNEVNDYCSASDEFKYQLPSIADLSSTLRLLYHFLIPLSARIPKTDLTHTSIAGYCALASIVAKSEYKTPMIVTDHGVFIRERYIAISSSDLSFFSKKFLLYLSNLVSKLCYYCADQISPVCNFNKKWELSMGAPAKIIQTIYNGVDPVVFEPREKPQRSKDRLTVVAAAHIMPLKDIKTMIRSCQAVREEIPNVQYIVYGSTDIDPEYTKECQNLINELDLKNHFFMAGFCSKKSQLYNTGDISILTSISEGFPYTVIESMACARPVVATDVGGVNEAMQGLGVLVKPRDVAAISEGVIKLLLDTETRIQMGKRARERILLHYRDTFSGNAYMDSYHRLLKLN